MDIGGPRPGRCRTKALAPDPTLRCRRVVERANSSTDAARRNQIVRETGRPMTSFRQFAANRRNALRSTGPKSLEGKRSSRRNAVRHGLTAETVIDGLEDAEDYRGFEAAVISDYNAETAVERELVLRLASLLWRLRRIVAIETDLFQIQAEILRDRRDELAPMYDELSDHTPDHVMRDETDRLSCSDSSLSARELTYCFLRTGNLDSGAFDRLGRYNAALWKQTAQTLFLLGSIRRRHGRIPSLTLGCCNSRCGVR